MEKLEKHIKKTLEERRITPSAHAWEKISSQIEIEPKQSGNKWLMYTVAASFIGIVVISIFFFRMETPPETAPQIVDKENTEEELRRPRDSNIIPLEIEQNQTEIVASGIEKASIEESVSGKDTFMDSQETTTLQVVKNQPLKDGILNTSDGLIAQKISEVALQVALLESVNHEVSDAEVDSLLRAAHRQILTEQILKSDKVDAMALLTEVEDELEEPFSDQIFDALKDGYFKLRTAVADRNN